MGKNSDIESISNSISKTILHELLIEYTNKPESLNHLEKEEIEYRGQSIKKIDKAGIDEEDQKIIRIKVVNKIANRLKIRYPDILISGDVIEKKVDEELKFFFVK
ncbi:hypothetical protein HYW76_03955 [Candidatus Pacearchaeota archaeon]|nr:hypothetical protein [Candidatus Pacearchaeota archaeon]